MWWGRHYELTRSGVAAVTVGLLSATAWAQPPAEPVPVGPATVYPTRAACTGPVRNALRWSGRALQDGLIGYPQYFDEPPLGYYVNVHYRTMSAKADPHRFTLYRTDFLPGRLEFSPTGATRFNLMASRLSRWQGPVLVEWSPDEPGLAEARRTAVIATMQRARLPITPDRVVLGPSIYPGGLGQDSNNYHQIMISRDMRAPASYTTSPTSSSGFGGGSGSGGGPSQ